MERIIPKSSKVKYNVFKNLSVKDIVFICISAIISTSLVVSNLPNKWLYFAITVFLSVLLVLKIEDESLYKMIFAYMVHLTCKKRFRNTKRRNNMTELQTVKAINDGTLVYKKSFAKVIEIEPIAFALKSEDEQDRLINKFARTFGILSDMLGSELHIVKLLRPITYDKKKLINGIVRTSELNYLKEQSLVNQNEFEKRIEIIGCNEELYDGLDSDKLLKEHFYFQIFSQYKNQAADLSELLMRELKGCSLQCSELNNEELGIYVKNSYTIDFDEHDYQGSDENDVIENGYNEKEIRDKLMPKEVEVKWNRCIVDGTQVSHLNVVDYPLYVNNAWGFEAFHIPQSKATLKVKIRDRQKAIKEVDKTISNLNMQYRESNKDSEKTVIETHIESLRELLQRLQLGNDNLYDVNFAVTTYDKTTTKKLTNRREARKILANNGMKVSYGWGESLKWFIAESLTRNVVGKSAGINSSSLAGIFPFIDFGIDDENGVFIGESNNYASFLDLFYRDGKARVNSNAFVVGQSGMGKSFYTKTLMAQLAAIGVKIICFDPEQEYKHFAENLGGVSIDVSSAKGGRINPLQIIKELDSDEDVEDGNAFFSHLNFLASFFKAIIPNMDSNVFECLNTIVKNMYNDIGVNEQTDISKFDNSKYPTFDDLYKIIVKELKSDSIDYEISTLRILKIQLEKFATGGRYSGLWNGQTTLQMDSNFINFDFRSLLVTENKTLANAQMLLILRYCNLEVIKNLELNNQGINRKIAIVIDEAHVYFNKEMMIALNFFSQMARRIRKYNGMIMFTTQNIADFIANSEIADKTTAILNACQYSFIYGLPPNAITDLVALYKMSKPLNDSEIQFIKDAEQGEMFSIISANSRVGIKVVSPKYIQEFMIKKEENVA